MNNLLLKEIIMRLKSEADEARMQYKMDTSNEFNDGRSLAFYEMLNSIKNILEVSEENLEDYGLNIDLEKRYL